ncbi:MAG: ATP-binding protein, partial [Desulfomonilia bacterium]|nr:ATP-binding protein [Desulfomonilia bacterium]
DIDAFSMALANLMENAVHYSPESPRVRIRIWKKGTHAFLEFSDSGIGIARDNVKDVFRMFKRLPEAITLWGSGTGMGLYVVKGIVKAHGGKIWLDPKYETAGTSFLIRLPLART